MSEPSEGRRPGRLGPEVLAEADRRLAPVDVELARAYPGNRGGRAPVHTVYVPADRYQPELPAKWGADALDALSHHAPRPELLAEVADVGGDAEGVYARVVAKLGREPVEDLRIDLEDGYGRRADDQEDHDAAAAGRALAEAVPAGAAPAVHGIRVKSLEPATRARGIRSLDLFLDTLLARVPLPEGFVLTFPKVMRVEQVEVLVVLCERFEQSYALPTGSLRFELQIETPQAVCGADGVATLARMVHVGGGRCVGLHYGTYDYSAACGVAAAYQSMEHPVADHAKAVMQVAAAGTGVRLSDGSTNVLPVGDADAVRAAWRLHGRLVRRSLERGFYQGWDLHPAQLVTRYAATYGFYRHGADVAAARLRAYVERADSGILDEPATAQALADFLLRGLDCGALDGPEIASSTGLDVVALRAHASRSA